jgi:hypothetical protein
MSYDKNDLHQFIDALESTPDIEKQRAFIRMASQDRATYLYNLRAYARDEAITLRKRSTLLNVERKLRAVDTECRNAGR